ncbi:hypothetical protein A3K48_06700 [candidate division WOR-1 bacterium RIFOXYA12_FULL_52_29]|uniref:Histidine kinase N-terminal 7TM region domain-containing protein n=1 Tax=candidate division WOR-1 bacterium RIFOXYC12_FULL_54_18 TaxID=1802584 RepID=A0A1F4T7U1_UNCSA|nr:MAG: hypothetical protein A3K44_06700 [candidate division WOR-1 bacterium RIFOXYA2_FULL_51_19]OGC18210.1 MAG: hypothetical protein A3K48_06700 [candidate division WOR-1 bacterium RIFOXYA12_FULL_52_29]OGC27065.1 MAG: hypothetical protein A3K32_06695 [candidate division WOR-1 bacterium RIFOXYB2_FULL_45_9]OGC28627.1 MAG: hypothetical protein A3K49_06700 [candidate division WOR-1 bacterium RIFOXYC12_FULL_54_18]OGC30918.1 MAG: hypothetical protein A2346_05920 [candidate division WOR-1 bacterium R
MTIFYLDLLGKAISSAALLGLAVYIFQANRYSLSNRNIAASFFFLALWIISLAIRMFDPNPANQLFYSRLSHMFGALAIAVFSYAMFVFPEERDLSPIVKWPIILFGAVVASFAIATGLIVKDYVSVSHPFSYLGVVIGGPLYRYYLLYWGIFPVVAIFHLVYRYFRSQDVTRGRIGYFLLAILLGVSGVILFNLFLPNFSQVDTSSVGPILILLPVLIIAYSIIRFGLFRITPAVAAIELLDSLGATLSIFDLSGKPIYAVEDNDLFTKNEIRGIVKRVVESGEIRGERMRTSEKWIDFSAFFLSWGGGVIVLVHDLSSLEKELISEQHLQGELKLHFERETALRQALLGLATVFRSAEIEKVCLPVKSMFAGDNGAREALAKMIARAEKRADLLQQLERDRAALEIKLKEIREIENQGVQREMKMIELKQKISELEEKNK